LVSHQLQGEHVPRLSTDPRRVAVIVIVVAAAEQFSDRKSADGQRRVHPPFLPSRRNHQKIRVGKSGGARSEVENYYFGVATLKPQPEYVSPDLPYL
jgi:hypothetical protein